MKFDWQHTSLVCLAVLLGCSSEITYPPGVQVTGEPVQEAVDNAVSLEHEDYTISALASFKIEARVLSTRRYRFDRGASLSPVDFALGWGRMSDEAVLDNIDITQHARFYFWYTSRMPIPRREISSHSANMHLIPATEEIARELFDVRVGEIVELRGFLVQAAAPEGFFWRSSLSRDDTGAGACELIWVEEAYRRPI